MTTQAEDLGKALDHHAAATLAASIHIHTGLSQIAEALGGRSTRQARQNAPGQPRMPGRVHSAAEPPRDAQDATQPAADDETKPAPQPPPEPQWSDVLATAANPAAVREIINRLETAEQRVQKLTEPVWLDTEALGQLPQYAVVLPKDRKLPRGKAEDGRWWVAGQDYGFPTEEITPARVLWTPEDNR